MTTDPAATFRALHESGFILPNAWDAVSARLFQKAGFPALGTTSAGLAFALGQPDGQRAARADLLVALDRVVRAVQIPVTADLEAGYGPRPAEVADTVRAALGLGVVGLNLEDATGNPAQPLFTVEAQVQRLAAARQAAEAEGVPAYLNARTDTYLTAVGACSAERLAETVRRGRAYLAAGADSLFVPGVTDTETVRALRVGIGGPLSVMMSPGGPSAHQLLAAGACRVSVGPGLLLAALGHVGQLARDLRGGTFDPPQPLPFAEVQGWFSPGP
ncbi:isocitrate lyase/phosphoenolpyruvate mutase family protein [Deinococcus sp. HMF7620]|uniref:Isocitrate lyase/phosphoenolpyruvate mutase family protein n=1 Tax=Deinococcus arboris TaxID=2682977 RepID=A0A7C9M6U5_9DEIO|nr:isocitrate lyase/phosphoenolpyruvate mutase family protein [Deinococcus arboris]MVN85779.1 isocitrate lyase/phosphoenolpyruvate mutase family protein [Deinococcus arboris]